MTRPAQRRKVKNPRSKVSRHGAKKLHRKNPAPIHTGVPEILLPHWSAKDGLRANYHRWGLLSRLNGRAGGSKENWSDLLDGTENAEFLMDDWNPELDGGIDAHKQPSKQNRVLNNIKVSEGVLMQSSNMNIDVSSDDENVVEEAVVERDETGKIIAIKAIEKRRLRNESAPVSAADVDETSREIIKALEAHAANGAKTERFLSPGEVEFVRKCIQKYGSNYIKMARDIKLNYLQLTPVQIEKKCQKFLETDQQ